MKEWSCHTLTSLGSTSCKLRQTWFLGESRLTRQKTIPKQHCIQDLETHDSTRTRPSASVISSQGIVQHPERDMHAQKRGITRWLSDKTKSYWANWVTLDDRTFHGNGNSTVRSVGIFLLVLVLPRGQVTYQWPGRIGSAWFSGSLDELIVNALVETAYRGCYITNPNNDVSTCSCHTGVTLHYSEEST